MIRLLTVLILQETDLALRPPGGFLKVRCLDLVGCSRSDPFTVEFDTPGARSGSEGSRWVSGGGNTRVGEVLSKGSAYY